MTLGTDGFGRSDTRAALRAPLRGRRRGDRPGGAALARLSSGSIAADGVGSECFRAVNGRARGYDRFASHPFRRKPWISTALTISEAAAAIRARRDDRLAYAEALLAQAAQGAVAQRLHPSRPGAGARRGARRRREARARRTLGPLHGVPLALKDNLDTADMPTTGGTPGLRGHRPKRNAPIVQKLLDAGAIVFGKANLHELAYGITNNNAGFGAARNPYDPTRIPGGSSGGVGVAVGARIVPGGIGSDTGGSVRIPAALCGIVGFRPTHRSLVAGRHRADLAHPRHAPGR